jgi:hypothetical protein
VRKVFLPIISIVLVSGCATAPSWQRTSETPKTIVQLASPPIGQETQAMLGNIVATKGIKSFVPAVRLPEGYIVEETSMMRPKHFVEAGAESQNSSIWVNRLTGEKVNCFELRVQYEAHPNWWNRTGSLLEPFCEDKDGRIKNPWLFFNEGNAPTAIKAVQLDVNFEQVPQQGVNLQNNFQELTYEGRVGEILKFGYYEYTGDFSEPTSSQEVQFDLGTSSEVQFNNLKLQVLRASSTEIVYVLLSNF